MGLLGESLCHGRGNDTAAGIALLEHAVLGLTAVLGTDHPDTRNARVVLGGEKRQDKSEESVPRP